MIEPQMGDAPADLTDGWRIGVAASWQVHELQNADRRALLQLQQQLCLGSEWGVVSVNQKWMPKGYFQEPSARTVDFAAPLRAAKLSARDLELGILTMTRVALIYFVKPLSSSRGTILPKPSTWCQYLKELRHIVCRALQLPGDELGTVFGRLIIQDLENITGVTHWRAVSKLLKTMCAVGVWSDAPQAVPRPGGLEASRKVDEAESDATRPRGGYLPLSDASVAEMGWRVAWLIENLGLAVVDCLKALSDAAKATPLGPKRSGVKRRPGTDARREALVKVVSDWTWRGPDGALIGAIPFDLELGGAGHHRDHAQSNWPPTTPSQVKELAKLIQTANLFVFLICTGGRISEGLSLQPDCVQDGDSEYVTVLGRTFKLVTKIGGAVRDWPIPKLGADALEVQVRLSPVLAGFAGVLGDFDEDETVELEGIWVRVGQLGKSLQGEYNALLMRMVRVLRLEHFFEDKNLHAHRFRKTIARLIALALVGAPKILMDLFGHHSIEMTLGYILTDPAIKSEMAAVAKAQVIMFAEDAISTSSTNGGPAAKRVEQAVARARVRLGKDFGDDDVHRLAETLTLSGTIWQLVRPGVLCTKGPQQAGACNRHVGHPEPAKCRSYCDHRLEMAALHDDVDRVIEEAVRHLARARGEDNIIMAGLWEGQILANLGRFDDLRSKWSRLPEVASLLAANEHGLVA